MKALVVMLVDLLDVSGTLMGKVREPLSLLNSKEQQDMVKLFAAV